MEMQDTELYTKYHGRFMVLVHSGTEDQVSSYLINLKNLADNINNTKPTIQSLADQ